MGGIGKTVPLKYFGTGRRSMGGGGQIEKALIKPAVGVFRLK
jgi:hypothetical protein